MRAAVFPAGKDGCSMFRLTWAARELARFADVTLRDQIPAVWEVQQDGSARCVDVDGFDADVAVFQRTFRHDMLAIQRSLQAKGVAVVVDIDDDVSALDPAHPTYQQLHPRTNSGRSWDVLREACRTADMVTVSTPALARKYAGHGRVRVIRNCIPRAWLSIERPVRPPTLGWTGTPSTHVGDLTVAKAAVQTVLRETGWRFYAIGDSETLRVLDVAGDVASWADLDSLAYPSEVAKLTVGMVPLRLSAFNASKSYIKGLEYAALGVPFIASPTPEYRRLAHELGVGRLADRSRAWLRELRRLMASEDLRLSLGALGRSVASNLTIEEEMAPQVWEAWLQAADNRVSKAA